MRNVSTFDGGAGTGVATGSIPVLDSESVFVAAVFEFEEICQHEKLIFERGQNEFLVKLAEKFKFAYEPITWKEVYHEGETLYLAIYSPLTGVDKEIYTPIDLSTSPGPNKL